MDDAGINRNFITSRWGMINSDKNTLEIRALNFWFFILNIDIDLSLRRKQRLYQTPPLELKKKKIREKPLWL